MWEDAMQRLLILGGGTAGTMVANKLRRRLDRGDWQVTVVDHDDDHLYQPGLLFLPFGTIQAQQIVKPRRHFLPDGVDLVLGEIALVDADTNTVILARRPGTVLRPAGHRDWCESSPGSDSGDARSAVAAQRLRFLQSRRCDRAQGRPGEL
nr:hypothetical protein GCM10020092_051480 [Actinoplanes digitatis]